VWNLQLAIRWSEDWGIVRCDVIISRMTCVAQKPAAILPIPGGVVTADRELATAFLSAQLIASDDLAELIPDFAGERNDSPVRVLPRIPRAVVVEDGVNDL